MRERTALEGGTTSASVKGNLSPDDDELPGAASELYTVNIVPRARPTGCACVEQEEGSVIEEEI